MTTIEKHAAAAGALCVDDGEGCCEVCRVSMDTCEECDGIGYHAEGCALADEWICPTCGSAESIEDITGHRVCVPCARAARARGLALTQDPRYREVLP